jgi:hypothetical protein
MRKQATIVLLLMLVFAGLGSSGLVNRSFAESKPLTMMDRAKRLGPKPIPRWYWHWLGWRVRIADGAGHSSLQRGRPKQVPRRIPRWAWRRLHFVLLARARATHRAPTGGETYERAISYTRNRPSFTTARTVVVSNASELKSAIADLRVGDLVEARGAFTVPGETVIKNRLPAPAELDLSGVRFVYSGANNLPAVWLDNAKNVRIFGGDLSTADRGGTCLLDYGSQHVLWWGFTAHDCGNGGVGVIPVNGPVSDDDFQGTIWRAGESPKWDSHREKGTGQHGVLLWDSGNSNAFTNNRFAFYVHDQPTGAAVQVGNSVPAAATGNVLYLKAADLTAISTIQTGGNGLQFWGASGLGMTVKYLEVDNAQGRALDANGIYASTALTRVTVEYGRASRTNQNASLNEPNRRLPWDWRGGVVYKEVLPRR